MFILFRTILLFESEATMGLFETEIITEIEKVTFVLKEIFLILILVRKSYSKTNFYSRCRFRFFQHKF